MKAHLFCAAFAAFLLLGATPSALHADCYEFYCTSYLTYSGGELYGYVEYDDPSYSWPLTIEGTLIGEYVGTVGFLNESGYGDLIASYEWPPEYNDVYYIEGDCYYGEDLSYYDGTTYSDTVTIEIAPTGESFYSAADVGYYSGGIPYLGGNFVMTLTGGPTGFYFDGGTVAESISGFSDGCYNEYTLGPTYGAPAGLSGTVSSNQYSDTISAPLSWFEYYYGLVNSSTIAPCAFSDFESLTYDGGGYSSTSAGAGFSDTTTLYSFRGDNSVVLTP